MAADARFATRVFTDPKPPMDSAPSSPAEAPSRRWIRHLPVLVRILMGLPLLVFGLNGFLNFIPPPASPLPAGAAAFLGTLAKTGYMLQLIGATQLIVGAMLVSNRFVPLALVLFAPFMVNSIAFHVFLLPSGLPMAAVFLVFELYLAWVYRAAYRPLLTARWAPVGDRAP